MAKPGPKPNDIKKDYRQWTVRCTKEDIDYIRAWIARGGLQSKKVKE